MFRRRRCWKESIRPGTAFPAARIGALLGEAQKSFDDFHPEKTVPALLEARKLVANLAAAGQPWGEWKLEELDRAIAFCAGLRTEAQADAPAYIPGASAKVELTALNRSPLPIQLTGIHLSGWSGGDAAAKAKLLPYNKADTTTLTVGVPAKQPLSQPFWLEPNNGNWYDIRDQKLIGRADILPEVTARFDFALGTGTFSVTEPLHYRYADPSRDEFVRPVAVEPPVAIVALTQFRNSARECADRQRSGTGAGCQSVRRTAAGTA